MSESDDRQLQKADGSGKTDLPAEKSIRIGHSDVLDLSGLSESQIAELKTQFVSGMLDVKKKAEELKVDVGALDAALSSFNEQTARATQAGASATITHTQTSSLGRTEVVIGNTDRAASGKISRSGVGEKNQTLLIVIVVAAALIFVAFALGVR